MTSTHAIRPPVTRRVAACMTWKRARVHVRVEHVGHAGAGTPVTLTHLSEVGRRLPCACPCETRGVRVCGVALLHLPPRGVWTAIISIESGGVGLARPPSREPRVGRHAATSSQVVPLQCAVTFESSPRDASRAASRAQLNITTGEQRCRGGTFANGTGTGTKFANGSRTVRELICERGTL